jgi:hypothetical protein
MVACPRKSRQGKFLLENYSYGGKSQLEEGYRNFLPLNKSIPLNIADPLNLKTAVGREKAVQAIDVHRKCINCVVTFWVMSQWFTFTRGCADFRDPTAVFRLKETLQILAIVMR